MSITIYPATLFTNEEGLQECKPSLPWQGNSENLTAEAKADPTFEGKIWEPNPEYMPFSELSMATGNFFAIMDQIVVPCDDECGAAPIETVFNNAHHFLTNNYRDVEIYVVERVFALREMARLGITRGATHLVWA